MHAINSAIALFTIGASAAILPPVTKLEAREESSSTWYLIGFEPSCGSFGCNANYAIFGGPDAIPGAPAFGLRVSSLLTTSNYPPPKKVFGRLDHVSHQAKNHCPV